MFNFVDSETVVNLLRCTDKENTTVPCSGHIIIVFVKHIVGDHTYNLGMIL